MRGTDVTYLAAVGGFVLLFGGGEFLVRGAVAVSRRFGLSPLLIGMTVVAWCTSAPELVVSMGAALNGSSDIALGNVVGSNIFNVLGVLGISAVIAPIVVKPKALRRDTAVMVAAALALAMVAFGAFVWFEGEIGRITGGVLLAALAAYVVSSYRAETCKTCPSAELHEHEAEEFTGPRSLGAGLGYLALGLGALVIGAQLLITGATDIARTFGVSEAVIGLSLVAVGTSLPELATSVVAAVRGHADVAVGNVVGSNIFNILGILGITALVHPIGVAPQMAAVDVWVMVSISVALAPLLLIRGRIGRTAGLISLALYAAYLVLLFG